jgi:hypothetical protein
MQVGEERFNGDDIRRLYESTSYPRRRPPAEIRVKAKSISAEIVVADSARPETPAADNTEMPLLDPKIGRGLFAAIALNLVLDGLSRRTVTKAAPEKRRGRARLGVGVGWPSLGYRFRALQNEPDLLNNVRFQG